MFIQDISSCVSTKSRKTHPDHDAIREYIQNVSDAIQLYSLKYFFNSDETAVYFTQFKTFANRIIDQETSMANRFGNKRTSIPTSAAIDTSSTVYTLTFMAKH